MGIRSELDGSPSTIGYKIRDAETHYVHIIIHTTGGKDYYVFVVLSWNCYPENSLCPASTLAIAMVTLVILFITVRRRAAIRSIKCIVVSVKR